MSEESDVYRLPDGTVRIFQRENADGYIFPSTDGDGYRFMIAHPYEFGASLAGFRDDEMVPTPDEIGVHPDWGAYQVFSLAAVSEIRDEYECVRDRIRHRKEQPRQIEPDPDALQEMIDALVIVERAVAHVQSSNGDERVRHYNRIDAVCDDPSTVISSVVQALESDGQQANSVGILGRLRRTVMQERSDDR